MIYEIHTDGRIERHLLDRAYVDDNRTFHGFRSGIEVLTMESNRWTYWRLFSDPLTGKPEERQFF